MIAVVLACVTSTETGLFPDSALTDETGATSIDSAEPGEYPSHLLVISIDTLRRDDLGAFGGTASTETLDRLLEEGVNLADHRSCSSWTYTGAACAMVGQDLLELDFFPADGLDPTWPGLPEEAVLLAERLAEEGFSAAFVSANAIIGVTNGFTVGFGAVVVEDLMPADGVVDVALDQLDALLESERWLLHAHFADPHLPHDPPAAYRGVVEALAPIAYDVTTRIGQGPLEDDLASLSDEEWSLILAHLQAWYDAELAFMDDEIERLLAGLEDRGVLDDTAILLWSDHGEQFGEHGAFTHRRSVHADETLALGAVWGTGSEVVTTPTSHPELNSLALSALGFGDWSPVGGPRFADAITELGIEQTVEDDGWRLYYRAHTGELTLYELAEDAGEQAPRTDDERVKSLWNLLEPRVEALAALHPDQTVILP